MSRAQKLRLYVTQRLHAALEEILATFEKTIVKYEQEAALCQEVISRQHALLCALNKPLMDAPSAKAVRQQVPPQNQDQDLEEPDHLPVNSREEQGEPLPDLDEADIIQFTYNTKCAAGPSPAGPDPDVQLVSSETEDSEDYSKELPVRKPSAKVGHRRRGGLRCRVCSRAFKTRRVLMLHVKAHLKEAEPVCGICGERFNAADGLKLHFRTHQTNKTQKRETHVHKHPDPKTPTQDTNAQVGDDGGATVKKRRRWCEQRRRKTTT